MHSVVLRNVSSFLRDDEIIEYYPSGGNKKATQNACVAFCLFMRCEFGNVVVIQHTFL